MAAKSISALTLHQKKPTQSTSKNAKNSTENLLEVFYCEQGSDEWHRLRIGIPTASKFSVILAEGKDGNPSKSREDYKLQLAGEVLIGEVAETFRTEEMKRGVAMEPEALEWYERTNFVDLERIGFARRSIGVPLGDGFVVGCSPDAMVPKKRRIVEVKTVRPDLLIPIVKRGAAGFPSQHRAQCQGSMWVLDAETCDLILYYRGWKSPPVFTIERDDIYIKRLAEETERFVYEVRMEVKDTKARGKGW